MRNQVTLFILLFISASSAFAERLPNLSVGSYTRTSGREDFCSEFTVQRKDPNSKTLMLGKSLRFYVKNSVSTEVSEVQPNCELKTENSYVVRGTESILVRKDLRICDGKIQNEMTKTATIRSKEITLRFEVPGAETETCVFNLK